MDLPFQQLGYVDSQLATIIRIWDENLLLIKKSITVTNARGEELRGVLSLPHPEVCNKKVVIFSQVGIGTKTGVGDYLRVLADRLTNIGFTILRVDQSGTGNSQGELPDGINIPELFRRVQSGCFKGDSLAVIDWVTSEFTGYQLYLLGECGGCVSQTLASADRMHLIDGLLMMAFPVLYYPLGTKKAPAVREFDAKVTVLSYMRKFYDPKSYLRVLSGRSDWRLFSRSSRVVLAVLLRKCLSKLEVRKFTDGPDHERFNWEVFSAFKKLIYNKKPILFLLPQLDNETQEFNTEFMHKVLSKHEIYEKCCSYAYLPETDHSIMFKPSRELLYREIINWFNKLDKAAL